MLPYRGKHRSHVLGMICRDEVLLKVWEPGYGAKRRAHSAKNTKNGIWGNYELSVLIDPFLQFSVNWTRCHALRYVLRAFTVHDSPLTVYGP